MKITKKELNAITNPRTYHYSLKNEEFENSPFLRRLSDVEGEVIIQRDALDELSALIKVDGTMVCPCAITLEDVEAPYSLDDEVMLSFEDKEDAYFVEESLDLDDLIISLTLAEVPIKVVKNAKIEYPSGDGWRVMTEADLQKEKTEELDPRLAILKEYRFDDEEE